MIARPLPPSEAEVLLCAARMPPGRPAGERLRALLEGTLDWDGLLRAAHRHEVLPLLHHSLRGAPAGAVPAAVLDQLQEQAYATAVRNLFLTTELLHLLDLLRGHGVLAVPFKGPLLAAAVYGSHALRPFVDLDVLVDARDVPRTVRLLEGLGYRQLLPLRGLRRLLYLQSESSFDYVREDGLVTVEVHWGLMPRYFGFPLRLGDIRHRLVSAPLGGASVPSLPVADVLLFLCLHGTKHRWSSLKWVCDVAGVVGAEGALDWDAVWSRADTLGGQRMLRLGLLLATRLLGATVPLEVAARLPGDAAVAALAAEVQATMFGAAVPRPAAGNLFYLRAMTSPWRRARYGLHVLTIPTAADWERCDLPEPLAGLYYPLHALRLLERTVRALRAGAASGGPPDPADRAPSGPAGPIGLSGAPSTRSSSRPTARPRRPTVSV